MLLTRNGQAVRINASDIRVIGRTTHGVKLINLKAGDALIGVSRVVEVSEEN
jgi:DNA gyrase subunit A